MIEGIEVVHVGSASRDVTSDDPRGWRLGGGVSYAALTTARLGLRTAAIVGADSEAERARELDDLRAAGVEVLVARLAEGPVFRNDSRPSGRVQACLQAGTPLPVPDPGDLPAAWLGAPCWSLVPVAMELADAWAGLVPSAAFAVLGWQGLLRRLRAGSAVGRRAPRGAAVVARADLVGVSTEDLGPGRSPESAARMLRLDARLVVTAGDQGGVVVERDTGGRRSSWRYDGIASARTVDPTGAGDVFLATLAAATIRPDLFGDLSRDPGWDVRLAAAAGSLAIEGVGLAGVPDLASVVRRAAAG